MNDFTESEINALAEGKLTNGCTDIECAKIELAVWGHSAITGTQLIKSKSGHERVAASFKLNNSSYTAWLQPSDKSVLIHLIVLIGGEEYFEDHCLMTLSSFFQFLNSVPNMFQFAAPNSLSVERAMGLQLLTDYSIPTTRPFR